MAAQVDAEAEAQNVNTMTGDIVNLFFSLQFKTSLFFGNPDVRRMISHSHT